MTYRPLALIAAIVLAHLLVFGSLSVVAFPPTPTPTRTPYPTFTPNPGLERRYVSPTATPTWTLTPTTFSLPTREPVTGPGPF